MKPLGWAIAMTVAGAATLPASLMYQVVDLGPLGGGAAGATAISASGGTAGWFTDAGGRVRAMADGRALDGVSRESRAYGINDAGQTVGIRFDARGNAQAVIWNADGSVSLLGGASAGSSYAMDINASGTVAGAMDGQAAIWKAGEVAATALAVSKSTWSTASAINGAGAVAGTAQLADGSFRAFTAGPSGSFWGYLGTLGGDSSYAQAMNDAGWVAGGSTIAQGYLRAFVYYGGLMRDLGTLGSGNSSAYGVNSAGQVVGFAQTEAGGSAAFLWQNNRMVDLNSLIAEYSGWRLLEASGINDRGQIVGRGLLGGVERAFRLDPTMAGAQTLSAVSGAGAPLSAAAFGEETYAMTADSHLENPVPEPSTWLMVTLGITAIAFGAARRR